MHCCRPCICRGVCFQHTLGTTIGATMGNHFLGKRSDTHTQPNPSRHGDPMVWYEWPKRLIERSMGLVSVSKSLRKNPNTPPRTACKCMAGRIHNSLKIKITRSPNHCVNAHNRSPRTVFLCTKTNSQNKQTDTHYFTASEVASQRPTQVK